MNDDRDDPGLQLVPEQAPFGTVLNPEILNLYKEIDKALPAQIVRAIDRQFEREYRYAVGGQIVAGSALLIMAAGFIFLVMNGHETPAYVLLGAGVLNTIGGFLRARLTDGSRKDRERKPSPEKEA